MQKCSDVSPKYVNVESWFVEVFTVNLPELRKIPDNPRKTVNQRFPDISRKSSLKNTFLTFFLPKKPARADALQQSWMAKSETFHTQSTSEKDIPVSLTACMTGKSIPQEMFPKNTSQGACLRELWYLRSVRARADGYSAEKSQRLRPYRRCPSLTTAGAYYPGPTDPLISQVQAPQPLRAHFCFVSNATRMLAASLSWMQFTTCLKTKRGMQQ